MKKTIYILIILLSYNSIYSQVLNSEKGKILNKGRIVIKGQAKIGQDTIGGLVEYTQDKNATRQYIPQITYDNLKFKGESEKRLTEKGRRLTTMGSFETDDKHIIRMLDSTVIYSNGWTNHNSRINPANSNGSVILHGTDAQDIKGIGKFRILELNNPAGADVRAGGGFNIGSRLTLRSGEFRNDSTNNFSMADSSEIERHIGGSLRYSPKADKEYSVRYKGSGNFVSGGELHKDKDVIKNLIVEDEVNRLELSKNAHINDSLYVGSKIYTTEDTLTLSSQKQAIFSSTDANVEIIGSFKLDSIEVGREYTLNNPYTRLKFESKEDMKNTKSITSTIFPDSIVEFAPQKKVTRQIYLTGYAQDGSIVSDSVNFAFDYGWRKSDTAQWDEQANLKLNKLVLNRWVGDRWFKILSEQSQWDTVREWAYSKSNSVRKYGAFAMGVEDSFITQMDFYAILEGAYIPNSKYRMRVDLWEQGLLDVAPDKNLYPLSLVANYNPDDFTQVPDSVVDWVVLEFRPERNVAGFFKLGFLRYNGDIIGLDGKNLLVVTDEDGINQNENYFVILRHRNHAPVITSSEILFNEKDIATLDFTDPNNLEGGTASLKMVDILEDGNIFALKAGFYVDENSIADMINIVKNFTVNTDIEAAYNLFTTEGYLRTDYNLDGIVHTRDFNISWNNRLHK